MNLILSKITKALSSRTNWTIFATFVVNTVPMVRTFIPAQWLPLVDAVLGLLAFYFHMNPKVNFNEDAV